MFFLLSFFAGIPAPVLAQVAVAAPPDRTVSDFWFDPASARILHDDARRALGNDPTSYDVVIGDAFTGIAVPAHLVTREFFEPICARLDPGSVFLMNVIDVADRLDALPAIVRKLRAVFPGVEVWAEVATPDLDAQLGCKVLKPDAAALLSGCLNHG